MKKIFITSVLAISLAGCGQVVELEMIPFGEELCKVAGGKLTSVKSNPLKFTYVCKSSDGKVVTIDVY